MSYYTELNHMERSWFRLQEINAEAIENHYRGHLTPDREHVVRMLNVKRKEVEYGLRSERDPVHRQKRAVHW